jgi:hypothetical protein
MAAFAGCLANQQPGSWAGAFRLREGTVVTVARDDLIVPDGDQLFLDETEARERLLQEISFGGLQRVYAPESWAIPGADNMPVSLLLDERRDVKLQPVVTPKSVWIIGGTVLILVLGGLGYGIYTQQQEAVEQEKLSALEKAKAAAAQMGAIQNEPVYPPPERKWEDAPQFLNIVKSCHDVLNSVPAVIAGWHISMMKCDGIMATTTWNREHGFSAPPKDWVISDSGGSATSSVVLPKLEPRGHEELANIYEVTRRYLTQNWPGTVARAPDDPLPQPPPDYRGQWNPPPAPWVKRSFNLTVSNLPAELPTYFNELPGTVATALTYKPGTSMAGGSWIVEGVIYENRN